jgi:hypothetical protein
MLTLKKPYDVNEPIEDRPMKIDSTTTNAAATTDTTTQPPLKQKNIELQHWLFV